MTNAATTGHPAFARRADRVQPSAIREFLSLSGDPRITSIAGGYPDPNLFPIDELHKIYDDLLSRAPEWSRYAGARWQQQPAAPDASGRSWPPARL